MTIHDDLLVADFSESFEQMRHYEDAFLKRLDFGFGAIVAVIGATAFLIEHFKATPFILFLSGMLLSVSSIAGILLVWSLARNRVYFAFVARYVNEIRALYISHHPGGLENKSGMYSDHSFPKIFAPGSSQSIDIYFLAMCVALLVSGAATSLDLACRERAGKGFSINWRIVILTFIGSFGTQVALTIVYWYRKERRKNADSAVHGKAVPGTEKKLNG
jgi:hypothetical protein